MDQPSVTPGKGCASWFVQTGRLRSGWRVVLYLMAMLLLQIVIGLTMSVAAVGVLLAQGAPSAEIVARISALVADLTGLTPIGFGVRFINTLGVVGLVWLFRRVVDKRSFASLGFQLKPGWWLDGLAGLAFALAMWLIIFVITLALGWATLTGFAWDSSNFISIVVTLAFALAFNLLVGISEETDARGYLLQNLVEGIRFVPAVMVSSTYFGALHLLNPGASLLSTLGIFFAGGLLAMGYYATGRLWFSIGLHAAWNFAEGPVFGFSVSGLNMGGLFHLNVTAPAWLLGGTFGPEAGALAMVIEIAAIVILFVWARKNHNRTLVEAQ